MSDITKTIIAAHLGGALELPENSSFAFRHARGAIDYVEFQVNPSTDCWLVVAHDDVKIMLTNH